MKYILNGATAEERARELRLIEQTIGERPNLKPGARNCVIWGTVPSVLPDVYVYRTATTWVAKSFDAREEAK